MAREKRAAIVTVKSDNAYNESVRIVVAIFEALTFVATFSRDRRRCLSDFH